MDPPPDLESSLAEGFSLVTTSGCGRWPHLLWHDWPSGPSSAAVNREHGELQVKLNDPTRNVGQLSETEFIGLCLVEYQGLPTFTSPIKATGGPGFHERDLLLGGAASQNTPSHLQRHRQVRHQLQQSPIREPPWPVEVVEIDDFVSSPGLALVSLSNLLLARLPLLDIRARRQTLTLIPSRLLILVPNWRNTQLTLSLFGKSTETSNWC